MGKFQNALHAEQRVHGQRRIASADFCGRGGGEAGAAPEHPWRQGLERRSDADRGSGGDDAGRLQGDGGIGADALRQPVRRSDRGHRCGGVRRARPGGSALRVDAGREARRGGGAAAEDHAAGEVGDVDVWRSRPQGGDGVGRVRGRGAAPAVSSRSAASSPRPASPTSESICSRPSISHPCRSGTRTTK